MSQKQTVWNSLIPYQKANCCSMAMQVPRRHLATYTCAYRMADMLVDSAPAGATIATESPSTSVAQRGDMTGSYAAAGAGGGISFPRARSEHGVKQPYIKRLRIR